MSRYDLPAIAEYNAGIAKARAAYYREDKGANPRTIAERKAEWYARKVAEERS